ncbi:MAG: F0F1 ATP synthase subunit A [Alphaproteobacteria bacterium]|nr:F0F1 ATP synthase subunit A [Rhodospirillaceae bacterium]MDG2480221.1 F0F1 ATP synthase subunit A [Alphaproteobacteria bacterium]MBT6204862.1 F0F1 ATP synthase subunit A [Rhodospirillaceae bacterium]MBT6511139.1 F0F1 ATP synthase subunit A [Rhodospirillaceae bacterium]MBT7613914.1 F0F1 ATP synthase subunit A [Rhodospirillaceae bacterium]
MATESQGDGGHGPLYQFTVEKFVDINIGGLELHITNAALWMFAATILVIAFTTLFVGKRAMVPGRMQSLVEVTYEFIANMIRDNVGSDGRAYFPFVFTLFMFILACNMLGMLPYSFTVTSQIVVTFGLAFVVFIGVTIIGFMKHGIGFFGFFLPTGVPGFLAPLVIPIEVLSYLIRPVSLGLRLFANLTAGHTMLKVFAGFIAPLGAFYIIPGAIPMAAVVGLTILEFAIAFLQAYVFAVLSCIYLHDALEMH